VDKIHKISPNPIAPKRRIKQESELLFLLSGFEPAASVLEKAQTLIPAVHLDSFVSLSKVHGVSSLVYRNLLKMSGVSQEILDRFCDIYHNCLRSNILLAAETDRLIDLLISGEIDVIPLKGTVTAELIFGDIGLYPSGDIDILVPMKDIGRVKKILEGDGYHLKDRGFDEYKDYFLRELYHISLSSSCFTVEPHWNLFMRYFTASPEFWWEESVTVSLGERRYSALSPEKNILYTAFRNFYKGFAPLRFLVLTAAIISHYKDEIDWKKLFGYAGTFHFENVLRVNLKLCKDFLHAPVPSEYACIKGQRIAMLYRLISTMVLSADDIHPLHKAGLLFLRDDLKGIARILLRRLFPPMGEIVTRYRLTPGTGKAVAYYAFNPMLLLFKKHRDRE
jgi:hypothetical protein